MYKKGAEAGGIPAYKMLPVAHFTSQRETFLYYFMVFVVNSYILHTFEGDFLKNK